MPQFYNPYNNIPQQPFYSSTSPAYVQPQQMTQQISNGFAWVQGEAAAKAYAVAPGTTMMLMDTENPILYMKSTDQTGRPQEMQIRYLVTKEEFEKLQNGANSQNSESYVTREEFEKYVAESNKRFVVRKEYRNG